MISSSSFGISQITLQFDLNRDIDAAAQDVQAAINAAGSTLPRNLPYPPIYSKVNPADAPIVTLALTSHDDLAAAAERHRRHAAGAAAERGHRRRPRHGAGRHPARRSASRPICRGSPTTASALEDLRTVDRRRQCRRARRARSTARTSPTPSPPTTRSPPPTPIATSSSPIATARRCCCSDVADVVDGLENNKVGGWYNGKPAIVVDIQRQPGANVIETVRAHPAPSCRGCSARCRPASTLTVVHDRTTTIRASIRDVQFTLVLSVGLVIAGGADVPAHHPRHHHRRRGAAAVADRDLRRDVVLRLLARQPVADGADHRHRLRGRRRHRDDREHRAPHGGGREPVRGGAARARARSASPSSR